MRVLRGSAALIGALFLFACSLLPATAGLPTGTLSTVPSATSAAAPPPTTPLEGPPEAIFLRTPWAGSEAVSPLPVEGIADPTFEQTLLLRLIDFEGTTLSEGTAAIEAPAGERGPFSGGLTFTISQEQPTALQVLATSPRDAGITHLTAQVITLLPAGTGELTATSPHPERIQIRAPDANATISGGRVVVRGFGLASFEGTLVVEVQDAVGAIVGQAPLIVDAPDLGQPGPFEVEVEYETDLAGPGRIVVFDPSPAYGGPVHLNSVEVDLQP